ncbi:glycosyltransferase family 39 protein [Hyphomicrobium sp.]|uniref:glycosyltransferase family 39 protein n=1 Tax=Hyphomicrobium sp. TaxID=82 RepID=UPI001D1C6714|nr:glycosyltransferase family 39 protein [Hyphomicrobium sp.]MBY0561260.1 glycosyltransferase family 39 protein [Hyphomicrobium sp.]
MRKTDPVSSLDAGWNSIRSVLGSDWLRGLFFVSCYAAFFVYAFAGLQSGHSWGDDFALYLLLAENILNGRPYETLVTGIIVPPGFPLVLSVGIWLFGANFLKLKTINILAYGIVVLSTTKICERLLGGVTALLVPIILFLVPFYYYAQQSILADVPFAAAISAALYFYIEAARRIKSGEAFAAHAFFLGCAIWSALLLRPAGLPLIPAVVLAAAVDAFVDRSHMRGYAILAATSVLAFLASIAAFHSDSPSNSTMIIDYFLYSKTSFFETVSSLIQSRIVQEYQNLRILFFWYIGVPVWPVLTMAAFGCGWLVCTKKDFVLAAFTACYLGMLVLTPWTGGSRYLLPLLPALCVFILSPLLFLFRASTTGHKDYRRISVLGLFVYFCLLLFVVKDMRAGTALAHGVNADEISDAKTVELFDWLKTHTAAGDVICSSKPRAVVYFSGHPGCGLDSALTELPKPFEPWMRKRKATFAVLILRRGYVDVPLDELLRDDKSVAEVFRNADYAVYKTATP